MVLCIVPIVGAVLAVTCWRFGPSGDGARAFLARFDLAPGLRCADSRVFREAGGETLRLDVCGPATSPEPAPLVICVHGGGWHGGSRDECFPLLVRLAREGFVAVAPDYRLAPKHRFPAQWDDLVAAIDWMGRHDSGFSVDRGHVAAVGWSAGGHLACLLGTGIDEWPARDHGGRVLRPERIRAVVALSPITDLTSPDWREIPCGSEALMGCSVAECPDLHRAASPVHEVTDLAPSFLLLHGAVDPVVPIEQSRLLEQALRLAGIDVFLREVPGVGHRWFGRAERNAYGEALTFLRAHLHADARKGV